MEEPVVVVGALDDVVVVEESCAGVGEDPDEPVGGELELVDDPLEELELGAGVPEELVVEDPDDVLDELPVVVVLFGGFATSPL